MEGFASWFVVEVCTVRVRIVGRCGVYKGKVRKVAWTALRKVEWVKCFFNLIGTKVVCISHEFLLICTMLEFLASMGLQD